MFYILFSMCFCVAIRYSRDPIVCDDGSFPRQIELWFRLMVNCVPGSMLSLQLAWVLMNLVSVQLH